MERGEWALTFLFLHSVLFSVDQFGPYFQSRDQEQVNDLKTLIRLRHNNSSPCAKEGHEFLVKDWHVTAIR